MECEDAVNFLDRLRMLVRGVMRRNDLFGMRVGQVRAPVGHDAVAGFRRIATSAVKFSIIIKPAAIAHHSHTRIVITMNARITLINFSFNALPSTSLKYTSHPPYDMPNK